MMQGVGIHIPNLDLPRGESVASPQQLIDIDFWFDASSITGVAADSPLEVWGDSSGRVHHANQVDPTHRPIYRMIDNRPAVEFSGVHWLDVTGTVTPTTTIATYYVVVKQRVAQDGVIFSKFNPVTGGDYFRFQNSNGARTMITALGGPLFTTDFSPASGHEIPDDTFVLLTVQTSGLTFGSQPTKGQVNIRLNSQDIVIGQPCAGRGRDSAGRIGAHLDGSRPLDGAIREIIGCIGYHNRGTVEQVENYLFRKWFI